MATKPPYRGTRLRSIRVPDELWQRAVATAAAREESVTAVLIGSLERYVRRHRKEQP